MEEQEQESQRRRARQLVAQRAIRLDERRHDVRGRCRVQLDALVDEHGVDAIEAALRSCPPDAGIPVVVEHLAASFAAGVTYIGAPVAAPVDVARARVEAQELQEALDRYQRGEMAEDDGPGPEWVAERLEDLRRLLDVGSVA